MKTLLFALTFLSASAFALDYPEKLPSRFVVIGISGLKTGRDDKEKENIFSKKLGPTMEQSGAWDNLPTTHNKILKNAYLTHFSTSKEIDSALKLMLDENNKCLPDTGLILLVNSWGTINSQKLAQKYFKKCGQLPLLTVLIEGIAKPTPFAYNKSLFAFNCVNFYQSKSTLQGGPIENCHNVHLEYSGEQSLYYSHIHAEWEGSEQGKKIIEQFMSGRLPLNFVKEQFGIDFDRGLFQDSSSRPLDN